jgi:short subunit fatty acids transporter
MEAIFDPLTVSSMGDITSNSWMTFLVIFVILLIALSIIAYYYNLGKKEVKKIDPQMDRYEKLYIEIDKQVSDSIVCESRYWYILKKLDELKAMKYKNKEMTYILENSFLIRYKKIRDEINSREEFDPGQVLK